MMTARPGLDPTRTMMRVLEKKVDVTLPAPIAK